MIPIAKNVIVVDEQGNEYEATYLKRAKGLVKNGRARFISENKICLACPPNHILEDKQMKNNISPEDIAMGMTEEINQALCEDPHADVGEIVRKTIAGTAAAEIAEQSVTKETPALNIEYVLARIDKIMNDTEHLKSALEALMKLPPSAGPGDITGAEQAEAISDVMKCRETTNQQTLRLLEKMYDDLKPKEPSEDILKFQQLADSLCKFPQDTAADIMRKAAQQMFVKPAPSVVMDN